MKKFKVGDKVVRTEFIEDFYLGTKPVVITAISLSGWVAFEDSQGGGYWNPNYFELFKPPEPEVKPAEQPSQLPITGKPKVDHKLRLTEMQKEAVIAGIAALNTRIAEIADQQNAAYDPSLTYQIEICKYQQEVLRSMLREVNR